MPGIENGPTTRVTWFLRAFPIAAWLRTYELRWLHLDFLAGITLAAYAIPVALAYAGLAGLPPQVGIYGYLLGGVGYALFGTSRQLAVGPTSAISLTVGVTLTGLGGSDPSRALQIAAVAAFTVAGLCAIAWLLHLSTLTNFISETILLGFKAGAGLSIASTQLAAFLGLPSGGDDFFSRVLHVVGHLGDTQPTTLLVGAAALALILLGERVLPGRPVALIVVVLATAAVALTPLRSAGLTLVGAVPGGLPVFTLPTLRLRDVDGILPLAFACVLLAYIEGVSAARTFATRHDYALDVRQELLALGSANLLVAFGGGYPVAGGLSQSAVNDKGGAKTPLALIFASGVLGLCLLFLTGLVATLPKAVLAAIVLVAVAGLINLRAIVSLRRVSRLEFRVAMVALGGVLVFGILNGVLIAAAASILLLLHRAAFPQVAFLGRIPGTRRFSDVAASPDNERVRGVLAFRVEAALLYFNAEHVRTTVLGRLASQQPPVRLVVCDLSTSANVDLAGARMLAQLEKELTARGIAFQLVEARSAVRELLAASGLEKELGKVERETSLADVVDAALASAPGSNSDP
jgi:sulfate permease, SulP family